MFQSFYQVPIKRDTELLLQTHNYAYTQSSSLTRDFACWRRGESRLWSGFSESYSELRAASDDLVRLDSVATRENKDGKANRRDPHTAR